MDLEHAIRSRRAVRAFTPESIDNETIHRLIEAAVWAPSAVNEQPWLFTVVRDRETLFRISTKGKAHLLSTPPAGASSAHIEELLRDPGFDVLHHAPALIVISSVSQSPWAAENCSLAAQNLMLTACTIGLGTCWIGFVQGWLNTDEGKKTIGLPLGCVPVAPIIVGCPKSPAPPVPRKEPRIYWIG
jgi:nitroreductase